MAFLLSCSPMCMAESRSLLASPPGLESDAVAPPLPYPAMLGGGAGGRGGGGGPGGGGAMARRLPGAGMGGRE